jgi:hypothetical protein
MTRGVLYYNRGTRCLTRLLVSLHSLRAYYTGSVCIAHEGEPPDWFRQMAEEMGAQIMVLPKSDEYVLIEKSKLWRVMPFDHTMFLDADTVVRGPVDEFLSWTAKHGCVVTKFNDWHTHRGRMRRRIEQWNKVAPKEVEKALKYGWAINTGIQGWSRGNNILPAYEEMTVRGNVRGIGKKMLDEIAMQLLIPSYQHHLAGAEWNCGCLHNDGSKARIVHYHGHKHCRDDANGQIWKDAFRALVADFPKHADRLLKHPEDDTISLWLAKEDGYRPDVTIVTAVNPAYADRLRENIALWMNTPGLKNQKFIVFVNGFKNANERKFLNLPNVRIVRWDYPQASPRETMLAAFILGVAREIKTKYWMKLDGDTKPIAGEWKWPDYQRYTITSHRWGYTKMKGDPSAKDHWFNRLDKVFESPNPFPKLDIKSDFRVSHRPRNRLGIPMRFGSFAHIEKTEFTRKMASIIKEKCGGRLPIPSQDTLSWYCANLWKEPVKLMNMKEYFQP